MSLPTGIIIVIAFLSIILVIFVCVWCRYAKRGLCNKPETQVEIPEHVSVPAGHVHDVRFNAFYYDPRPENVERKARRKSGVLATTPQATWAWSRENTKKDDRKNRRKSFFWRISHNFGASHSVQLTDGSSSGTSKSITDSVSDNSSIQCSIGSNIESSFIDKKDKDTSL